MAIENPQSKIENPPGGGPPAILGDFELLDRIGQGAMGVVYKARQRSMDRVVAVKVLKPALAHDAQYVERFWREARAAARLSHPNIVLAINAGEDQGLCYFVMEYVEGHTVALLLKARPLDEAPAFRIALQVAQALDYAWSHERIVHRDIKPGNVIITPDGTAKLADLGLAHEAELAGEGESGPQEAGLLGTPSYMSPEQIRRTELDVRSDLYALGASLFHMVAGRPPFEGADAKAVLTQHLREPAPDPRTACPQLSDDAARIILRLLAKERDARYPTAQALVADIEALLRGPAPRRDERRGARDKGADSRLPIESRKPKTKKAPVLRPAYRPREQLLIWGSVAAVILLLLLVLTGGRGCRRRPTEPGVGTGSSAAALAAQADYEAAEAAWEANPRDYASAIRRFREIESAYSDTPHAGLAANRRKELETDLDQKAGEALANLKGAAQTLIQQGKYADALAGFARFPDAMATPAWRERVAAAKSAAERDARQRFEADLAAGKDADDEGELDEAARIYQSLGDSLPPAWREEAAKRLEGVRQRQREAARAELDDARRTLAAGKAAEAAAALRAFLERYKSREPFAPLCAEAKTLLDQAAAPKPTPAAGNARLRIACDGPFKVYLNGKPVGSGDAREGAFDEFPLAAKAGDVLAVEAAGKSAHPGLYALLSVDNGAYLVATDATWRSGAAASEGWQTDPLFETPWPAARPAYWPHVKPGYAQAGKGLPGYWIWGRGERGYFRKTLQLQKTAAALEAEERAREKALTAKFGAPAKATLWLACRESYLLYLNGTLAGAAAAALPQGATYALSVRQGDVLGVQATAIAGPGSLEARLDVEGHLYPLLTDRSWAYPCAAPPPDDWNQRGTPSGRWRASEFADATSHRIWGEGQALCFRKTVDLTRLEAGRLRHALYFHGAARSLADGRTEIAYDFRDPEQLADWSSESPWLWAKGAVVGTTGLLFSLPFRAKGLQVDAQIESAGDPTLGIWGDEAGRDAGYTLRFTDFRQGTAMLCRNRLTLSMAPLPTSTATRRISLSLDPARRRRGTLVASADGRPLIDTVDNNPIPLDELWRVGFRAGTGGPTLIGSVRITATPDLARLRAEASRRGVAAPEEK